jgi:hypothetical protein
VFSKFLKVVKRFCWRDLKPCSWSTDIAKTFRRTNGMVYAVYGSGVQPHP